MAIFKDGLIRQGASGSGVTPPYQIDNSIRFDKGDSQYMKQTFSGAGNRTKWTYSLWFKLSGGMNDLVPASGQYWSMLSNDNATNDSNRLGLFISGASDESMDYNVHLEGHGTHWRVTQRALRDPSAWYHLVVVWDTGNNEANDRIRIYINGERESSFREHNNPAKDATSGINLGDQHTIGAGENISNGLFYYHWDGLMAEIFFLDGYAYDAEYFGEFSSEGIWRPIDYNSETGDYGTNGFYMNGTGLSGTTLNDQSTNSNNFTLVGGQAAHDVLPDTPTNNFATFHIGGIHHPSHGFTNVEGGLEFSCPYTGSGSPYYWMPATIAVKDQPFYVEFYPVTATGGGANEYNYAQIGIFGHEHAWTQQETFTTGTSTGAAGYYSFNIGRTVSNGVAQNSLGGNSIAVSGDIVSMYYAGSGNAWLRINGDFIDHSAAIDNSFSGIPTFRNIDTTDFITFWVGHTQGGYGWTGVVNFGQDSTFGGRTSAGTNSDEHGNGLFKYSVPSGAIALCTKSLAEVS